MQKSYSGIVVKGLGNGKKIGFPTLNIKLIDNELSIEVGVYVVTINIQNVIYKGMLYVGSRPTLNLKEKSIEIHVLNFEENIYNEQISFQIWQKIRDEVRFENIERLMEQLHHDKEMVYNFFQNNMTV